MKARTLLKAGICFAAMGLLIFSMMGMCLAGDDSQQTSNPLGDVLNKLEETVGQVVDILTPGGGTQAEAEATASGDASTEGSVPGLDTLTGALDPSSVPGLDALTGALDPSSLPFGSLPSLPGMPEIDPMGVLQIVDYENQLFVVLDLDGLAKAEVGLGKNLEKAPLLELGVVLFDALAAGGSLGIKKVDDNAFMLPLDLYLQYMSGEDGWKDILAIDLPLKITFPGAGMVPEGVQKLIDTLYKYILKPILSMLPIYREVKPDEVTPTPDNPSVVPPTEVGGEVVENAAAGGSGDHLPFTGAELTVLLILILSLAVGGFLLSRFEKTVRRKAG